MEEQDNEVKVNGEVRERQLIPETYKLTHRKTNIEGKQETRLETWMYECHTMNSKTKIYRVGKDTLGIPETPVCRPEVKCWESVIVWDQRGLLPGVFDVFFFSGSLCVCDDSTSNISPY